MKVFMVTACEYSDMHVVGIFSSKEKAQECIDTKMIYLDKKYYERPNSRIIEFELDSIEHPELIRAEYDTSSGEITFDNDWWESEDVFYYNTFSCLINFNPNIEVMKKVVYDRFAMWKAKEIQV